MADAVLGPGVDVALALLALALGWRAVSDRDPFAASVTFTAFGLVVALIWARLGAPDVALAEAALGAGVTGALLVDAARELARPPAGGGAEPDPPGD